ncbi:D-2-hydroxyacid dehydrogenase [Desulfosporosinus sp. PR]|uniref:D-2-hydroxyacid dehydrogenase n=1 Tax=Candidatus Desulfosporosinus nitrosoreducens TaxID=3401928 RepID=UPI0027F89428|nr:D-2-hydroxyacid dehydrogenase [Desulfosporosinus sp. PR]MDQ7093599.1 D-2-hydroxyacid dehydrogenase [Desulfosporosinus sp. PR]
MTTVAVLYQVSPRFPNVIGERHIQMIQESFPDVRVVQAETEQELIAQGINAEILLTWGLYRPNEYLNYASNLQWVHSLSSGVDGLVNSIGNLPVKLSTTKGIHGLPMADHVLGYILSFLRGFPTIYKQQQKRIWQKLNYPGPQESKGKTVGIIGMGEIGREIARKCKLFEMRVLGVKRTPAPSEFVDEMYGLNEMDKVLQVSDFVVILIPLTPDTVHNINEEKLRRMKKTAYLINVGRGPVVDEEALIKVLKEGAIAGAALDATEVEPLSETSPLWGLDNVIITPHMAADSPFYMDRAFQVFYANLRHFLQGERLQFEVTMDTKY